MPFVDNVLRIYAFFIVLRVSDACAIDISSGRTCARCCAVTCIRFRGKFLRRGRTMVRVLRWCSQGWCTCSACCSPWALPCNDGISPCTSQPCSCWRWGAACHALATIQSVGHSRTWHRSVGRCSLPRVQSLRSGLRTVLSCAVPWVNWRNCRWCPVDVCRGRWCQMCFPYCFLFWLQKYRQKWLKDCCFDINLSTAIWLAVWSGVAWLEGILWVWHVALSPQSLRSCFNLCPWNFYRTILECFLIFQRRIAGYVTAKKGKTGKIGHKKTSTSWGQCK